MEEPKFCVNCKHYAPSIAIWGAYYPPRCRHPQNMSKPELVHGRIRHLSTLEDLRKPDANCGEAGAWFEAAPPEPAPAPKAPEPVVLIQSPRGLLASLFGFQQR